MPDIEIVTEQGIVKHIYAKLPNGDKKDISNSELLEYVCNKYGESTDLDDPVNHPKHYNSHPSGIECIEIASHYDFSIGNAIKYLWRHGLKEEEGMTDEEKSIEDLEKAKWYIDYEIGMIRAKLAKKNEENEEGRV